MKQRFNFNFMGKKKIWYSIAIAVIIVGVISLVVNGLNLGIDFTGGTILQVQYSKDVSLEDVRDLVTANVEQPPTIQQGDNNQFSIRTSQMTDEQNIALLEKLDTLGKYQVLRNEMIGPVIGAHMLNNAKWALLVAAVLMLIYITIRFRFNFAIGAIIALIHDVFIMVTIFALFKINVDSSFIAAVLTIIGYSINNTIVIFDRIRENSRFKAKMEFGELVNTSINQTLTRTINTIVAILVLLLCLLFLGGETTRIFVLALTIGIIAGFFSSVFLVGPIVTDLTKKFGDKKHVTGKASTKVDSNPNLTKKNKVATSK